ncbi:unnamed protein product [Arabidopsis lyrata]|uniref:Uncharacterized protein n=1 Tax=Arabidopsis thaliana x Arabidopsis arenosa TaxID=1240361 RepID=A0A8T1YB47_9BRAS|nr:hypothetical protein ISN45_Aa07g010750 [Arabidopsis thaliana x Arabidopsis arenosa]CAH8279205.1 unnamed protein product [Arabidopsis lyrata]
MKKSSSMEKREFILLTLSHQPHAEVLNLDADEQLVLPK